ncbi:MAG: glycosyltransferase family 2 protein [Dehalococcoidia bacterium]
MRKISIIIPALNEEETIEKVISEIPRDELETAGFEVQILVVDNSSDDRTGELAMRAGAEVILEPKKGKGRAVRTALKSVEADFVFMLDADWTYPPSYIPEMLKLLNGSDVVIGSRLDGQLENGSMSGLNLVGNRLLSLMASVLYNKKISDVCTGYWGFKGEVVRALNLRASGFELEAELFTCLAKKGCSMAELSIHYRKRATCPKLNIIRDGIKIGWTLITRRFTI